MIFGLQKFCVVAITVAELLAHWCSQQQYFMSALLEGSLKIMVHLIRSSFSDPLTFCWCPEMPILFCTLILIKSKDGQINLSLENNPLNLCLIEYFAWSKLSGKTSELQMPPPDWSGLESFFNCLKARWNWEELKEKSLSTPLNLLWARWVGFERR